MRWAVSREWSGGVFEPRGKKGRRSGPNGRGAGRVGVRAAGGSGLDCCVGWAAGKGRGVADWAGNLSRVGFGGAVSWVWFSYFSLLFYFSNQTTI